MTEFAPVLNVSALNGTNGYRLDGDAVGDYSGRAVAGGGDVNGDGFADLLIGAHFAAAGSGLAWVVFGGGTPPAAQGLAARVAAGSAYRFLGEGGAISIGYSISNAGDVNGDGFDDFIIGAQTGGIVASGSSYLVFGGTAALEALDNADGGDDNRIALTELTAATGYRIQGATAGEQSGQSVSGAGDVNGDGFADLLIGSPRADVLGGTDNGASTIVFGGAANLSGLDTDDGLADGRIDLAQISAGQGLKLNGIAGASYDFSGRSVSLVGDVNGDGFGDALVGNAFADPSGPNSNEGAAYLVFGKAQAQFTAASLDLGALSGLDGTRFDGAAVNHQAGSAVNGLGDVNGDGFADIVIGAKLAAGYFGSSYVVFGKAGFGASSDLSALTGADGFRLDGGTANETSGISVSAAGDVNGDGFDDILIGAISNIPAANAGRAYVVFGKASGFAAVIDLGTLDGDTGFRIEGQFSNDRLGRGTFGAAGDVNGDGFDDIIVASYGADNNMLNSSGSTYIVYGHRADTAVVRVGTALGNVINGGQGIDTISGLGGNDTLNGWEGGDTLSGGLGNDTLEGGSGPGSDVLVGGGGLDTYLNVDASDTITEAVGAAGGFDTVRTSLSVYTLAANVERLYADTAAGFTGIGNAADNRIYGNNGADRFRDYAGGADNFSGGNGSDSMYFTGTAAAILNFATGVHGGSALGDAYNSIENFFGSNTGNDTMTAGAGRAIFNGQGGNDTLNGGANIDRLFGGTGTDTLNGGGGSDVLQGGAQNDTLAGGAAKDFFVYTETAASGGFGADTITDWQDGVDVLKVFTGVADAFSDFAIAKNGTASVTLTLIGAATNTITLNGAGPITISAADFLFF